jgi:hypothetical protein
MNGTISSIENHGSIVVVWLGLADGRAVPVYFDRRAFLTMAEAEGAASPDDLIGRPACFDGHGIEFLDTMEAA